MPAIAALIDLIQQELDAYRRDGRDIHLAHAARALGEALSANRPDTAQEKSDVGAAQKGR